MASTPRKSGSEKKLPAGALPPQELYPTVAISDIFNAAGHVYGAWLCYDRNPMAAMGLSYVALAATAGVFRFGVNRDLFLPANSSWAELAGFVGLPLAGHSIVKAFLLSLSFVSSTPALNKAVVAATEPAAYLSLLVLAYVAIAAYTAKNEKLRDLLRTVVAFLFFILPLAGDAIARGDNLLLGSVGLFLFGGVAVGAKRDKLLLGVRRENWFHYIICAAAIGIGTALAQL